ncbi:nucleotidyltransferase domain-containing protein [Zunongwangia pacifica]|uniref:Uncharacterized protein n=1 Tax=Zunongwangia pacifica TaxID=2911062 RepID=A0A9X1ZTT1_9FLAO|nr:hypothetical protein [Zunongwangia pacifica]MCL6219100.1 hypothetical protein [Zunongwangia pacifica]
MIKDLYKDRMIFFINRIENHKLNWALTGSYRLFLEGGEGIIRPNDIDILTDKEGAKSIKELFEEYIAKPFGYSTSGGIKSYYGQLKIGEIDFDIMSEVFNEVDRDWIRIPNLECVEYLTLFNRRIPVLPLEIERKVSEILNRREKLDAINKIIEKKKTAENRVDGSANK